MKFDKGHVAILATNIIFGLNITIAKTLMPEFMTSGVLTYLRMIGAALLFWTASLFVKREIVTRKDLLLLLLASAFGVVINQSAFIYGLSRTTPIDASIVVILTPILTMLLAAVFQKEPITLKKAIGIAVGATGAAILVLSGGGKFGGTVVGNLFCLLSSLSYAIYLTAFKPLINRYSAITLMKWMFLYASVISMIMYYNEIVDMNWGGLTFSADMRLIYVVGFSTFLAYLLIPIAQKTLRPTTLSMYNYIQPLIASLVAVALGIDSFGIVKTVAGVLVFVGVYIVTQSKSRAHIEAMKTNINPKD